MISFQDVVYTPLFFEEIKVAFHEDRLPEQVERGVSGGPGFNTTILSLSGGAEKRNINFSRSRGRWDVGYGIQTKEDFQEVLGFFYTKFGRGHSFLFKDWSDFEIGVDATDTPQTIGTGDGIQTVFPIVRRYATANFTFDRVLERINASPTPRVFIDAVEQVGGFTVQTTAATVTFTVAPALNELVGMICEFDSIVRFDTDTLDVTLETFEAGAIPTIPIVEVRDET